MIWYNFYDETIPFVYIQLKIEIEIGHILIRIVHIMSITDNITTKWPIRNVEVKVKYDQVEFEIRQRICGPYVDTPKDRYFAIMTPPGRRTY